MKTVDDICREIVIREGGLVDDPADAGGVTNHGVSLRYARGIGLDFDGDGDTDADDIVLVTPAKAAELYKEDFWRRTRICTLPEALWPVMTDFAVNSGANAGIVLQKTLNEALKAAPDLGYAPLIPDGGIGPKTRIACERAYAAMGPYLINALCDAREAYLRSLAEAHPEWRKYVVARNGGPGGWITRAREFRVPVPA